MNVAKRTLAVLIVVLMAFAMMPMPAQAASTAKVYMKVTQNNAKAQQVLKYINKERKKRGLKKLKLDKSLTSSAITRAAEVSILVPKSSPHKRPNGKVARSINKKINYECCLEATGYTPKAMVHSWMTSPSHKKGILLKNAKSIGISYVTTVDGYQISTLEISKSKAKSVLKSKSKKTMTKKVVAKGSLIKAKYFKIRNASTMKVGASSKAKVIYSGPKAFGPGLVAPKSFRWTSSNTGIATVSSAGVIKAKKAGTVTIKAKLKSGSKFTISKKITVKSSSNGQTETYEQKVLKNRQKLFDYTVANGNKYENSSGRTYYQTKVSYGSQEGHIRSVIDGSETAVLDKRMINMIVFPDKKELRLVYFYKQTCSDDDWETETLTDYDEVSIILYTDRMGETAGCISYMSEGEKSDIENYEEYMVTGSITRSTYAGEWNDSNVELRDITINSGEDWLSEYDCQASAFDFLDAAFTRWDSWLSKWTGISGINMYSLGFSAMGN